VIKEGLDLLGIDAGPCMEPVGPMSADERRQLKRILIDMKLLK
jgi:4-hydroxy-tetrahydrodipicolinate synthase